MAVTAPATGITAPTTRITGIDGGARRARAGLMDTQGGRVDLIVRNCMVRTLAAPGADAGHEIGAVAVRGGTIVAVGPDDEITALASPVTQVIDGAGGTLLPAVIDSHTHFHRAAIFRALFLDFDELASRSVDDVVAAVGRRAAELPEGAWIQGDNLRDYRLAERRWPNRHELDRVAPGHPVVLRSLGKHLVVANSLALRIAGIDSGTADPPGGKLDRDEAGEPLGVLHETAKLRLDAARSDTVVPPVSIEDRLAAVEAGIRQLQQHGVSTIHEIVTRPDEIADFQLLREAGRLGIRVRYYVRAVEAQTSLAQLLALGLRSGFGDDWIRLAGIKISVDGSCESRNAALFEPYPGQAENRGLVRVPQAELDELIATADLGGLQVSVHAIGPRAADMALTSYERALGTSGANPLRHRLEHAYVTGPRSHFERARAVGLWMSEQPGLIRTSGDAWREIFGEAGLTGMMPLRMMLDMGLPVIANSDFPSAPMNPLVGMRGAVERRSLSGVPIDPAQAVTVDEITRMMTTAGAAVTGEGAIAGTIEPGRRADLRLLDRDPYLVPPDELDSLSVRLTVLDGRVVHADAVEAAVA